MVDFEQVISRLKNHKNLSTDLQVAQLFELSPQDFNKRKKRGTLLSLLVDWAISERVDIDWLLTGKGDPLKASSQEGRPHTVDEPEATIGKGWNSILLKRIVVAIEKELNARDLELDPEKKAEAICLLYELYEGTNKQVEEATVGRYLRLVA